VLGYEERAVRGESSEGDLDQIIRSSTCQEHKTKADDGAEKCAPADRQEQGARDGQDIMAFAREHTYDCNEGNRGRTVVKQTFRFYEQAQATGYARLFKRGDDRNRISSGD
jgi:hypothetical protein